MSLRERIVAAVRAALEHEPRINLHQYPIHLEWSAGDLIMEGEVEHIAAKTGAGISGGHAGRCWHR